MAEKDQILFVESKSTDQPSTDQPSTDHPSSSSSEPQSAFNEETGEINWVRF